MYSDVHLGEWDWCSVGGYSAGLATIRAPDGR